MSLAFLTAAAECIAEPGFARVCREVAEGFPDLLFGGTPVALESLEVLLAAMGTERLANGGLPTGQGFEVPGAWRWLLGDDAPPGGRGEVGGGRRSDALRLVVGNS